jgi:hypothetical protein
MFVLLPLGLVAIRNFFPLPNDHRAGDVLTQNGAMETQDG